jgi:hypothetical protein
MATKKKAPLKGEALRQYILNNAGNKTEEFVTSINRLSDESLQDLHSFNHGFSGISEMDSIVIRADILVERSLRSLAATIANNPIPDSLSMSAIKGFLRLMEPADQPYLTAIKELNAARNIIAHEMHGDYLDHIAKLIKSLGLELEPSTKGLQAAVIILIAFISNRRGILKQQKNMFSEYINTTSANK